MSDCEYRKVLERCAEELQATRAKYEPHSPREDYDPALNTAEGQARAALSAPCSCAELREQLAKRDAKIVGLRKAITLGAADNHRRNVELDTLHYVWCDGGCELGIHRFGGHPPLTQEIVEAALDNTRRLVRKFENIECRKLSNAEIKTRWESQKAIEAERDSLRAAYEQICEQCASAERELNEAQKANDSLRAELAKANAYTDFEESRIAALCEVIGAEDSELAADKVTRLRAELAASQERERVLRETLIDAAVTLDSYGQYRAAARLRRQLE